MERTKGVIVTIFEFAFFYAIGGYELAGAVMLGTLAACAVKLCLNDRFDDDDDEGGSGIACYIGP